MQVTDGEVQEALRVWRVANKENVQRTMIVADGLRSYAQYLMSPGQLGRFYASAEFRKLETAIEDNVLVYQFNEVL